MRRLFRGLLPLSVAVLSLCPAGCRYEANRLPESGATLEGTVTYGRDKVPAALIIAEGDGYPAATAWVDDDGHYKLENVPLGEVRIGVNTKAGEGRRRGQAIAQSQGKGGALPNLEHVPEKYFNPTDSGITTTIHEGANTFNVAIREE